MLNFLLNRLHIIKGVVLFGVFELLFGWSKFDILYSWIIGIFNSLNKVKILLKMVIEKIVLTDFLCQVTYILDSRWTFFFLKCKYLQQTFILLSEHIHLDLKHIGLLAGCLMLGQSILNVSLELQDSVPEICDKLLGLLYWLGDMGGYFGGETGKVGVELFFETIF